MLIAKIIIINYNIFYVSDDIIIDKLNHLSPMMAAYNSRMDDLEKKFDKIMNSKAMNKENRTEDDVYQLLPIKTMDSFNDYEKKLTDN